MKVTGVVSNLQANRYNARLRTKRSTVDSEPQTTQPSFKGDLGRGIGGVLGFIGSAALVTAATTIGLPVVGAIAAVAVGSKACADAGDKWEEEHKNKNNGQG